VEKSELQAQIEKLQYELNAENQRGGLKDAAKVESLEAQITELTAELDKPVVDPVIAKANEEVELFGTALYPFCKNELSYNAIRSSVISKTYALMDTLNDAQKQAEEAAEITSSELSELSQQIEDRDAIISGLRKELFEAKELAEDNANKRDAACRELLEASQTIDTLKDKLAAAEVTVPKARTNVEGSDQDAAEAYKQSLPAIYDVQPLDNRGSRFSAKFAATDEAFEDYYIYKDGKYREVAAEEASTFRTEYLAAQQPTPVEEDHSHDIPDSTDEVAYTAPAFRYTEEDGATGGLDQADAGSEVAGKSVEERLTALELAVFGTAREAA
jgi:DNA repair exonuclease SbcCD ATPase subunit